MTTYGLTTEGLVIPTFVVIREALNQLLRNTFGASLDLGDRSILGQLTAIIADRYAGVWEKLEAVNSSQDPDKASGAALEALCALTGTFRPAASYSAVVLSLTGAPTTLVPAGNEAETLSTSKLFVTREAGTITAVPAWTISTAYALETRVTNNGSVYECITAGTSAGSGGPTSDDDDITDNTAHWTFIGQGTGVVDVEAWASETGPITAFARDITVRRSSVPNWDGVMNLRDANLGRNQATDGELRLLREQELSTGGNSTVDALRAELLNLAEVLSVTIFVNNTMLTDADGVPPKSIEPMVRIPVGAEQDQRVFDALLAGVAAGIATHSSGGGAASGFATDAQGTQHLMKFTRPAEVPIYIAITVTVDSAEWPVDGEDQIKEAIVEWGDARNTGDNAVAAAISARAFGVDGVLDVTSCLIDDAPAPASSATVAINLRQLATYDTSRISITVNTGVP